MSLASSLIDRSPGGTDSVRAGATLYSPTDDRPGAAWSYLHADPAMLSAPRHARREVELRARGIVLDLLALALIDRTDVKALTAGGIRAHCALGEMDVPVDTPSLRALDVPCDQPERERERHDEYLEVALRAGASARVAQIAVSDTPDKHAANIQPKGPPWICSCS
jgi:hypothetical protein